MNTVNPRHLEEEWPIRPENRERRLEVLRKLKEEMKTEPPKRLYPPPEDLIREDRER